jgi:(1->4)-alpha-D-glucan 1-alpha-D-glucosylmutase
VSTPPPSIPRASYRLQFHAGFTFADAAAIVPYLAELGVSHVYASPYFKARAGSTHGYDISDHNALNPEIGDEASFDAFCGTIADHAMGQILDFVPNHMGVGKADNGWWLDVLEWGEESPYATYFDIDWNPAKPQLRGKVLLPFLGDHYGKILTAGELKPSFDAATGTFGVWYYEHLFPIFPGDYFFILRAARNILADREDLDRVVLAALEFVEAGFAEFRRRPHSLRQRSARRATATRLKRDLAEMVERFPPVREAIDRVLAGYGGSTDNPKSFRHLHRLLERQHYRLAHWRVAAEEINYRRFFQINDLAGIRVELAEVFDAVHALLLRLIGERRVHGIRIDHVDGLFDPKQYLERLSRRAAEAAAGPGDADGDRPPFFIVVEKILAAHESLRQNWPIAGTTGYEFLNRLNGVFVDPAGEAILTRLYRRVAGDRPPFAETAYLGRKLAMDQELASELRVLSNEINHLTETSWLTRDYTLVGLRQALRETVACFPVYRTYVDREGISPEDRRDLDWAVAHGRRRSARADLSVFDFLYRLLTTDIAHERPRLFSIAETQRLAMKFQQYTGAVMAKGLEDTAFYRHNRLLSLNEVGGDPERFGTSVPAFHYGNQDVSRRWPQTMLTTSTHDTKRGEDVRARINVISELASEWWRSVRRWTVLNRSARTEIDGAPVPDANEEYGFYQTLIGAWPQTLLSDEDLDADAVDAFRTRIEGAMLKTVREAKEHSSWVGQNEPYERALLNFVGKVLDVRRRNPFLEAFRPFVRRVAFVGAINGLAQTTLKLTVPGMPDFYQGSELWDLALVDPDNRRPVDFDLRRRMLAALRQRFADGDDDSAIAELLEDWPTGRIKMFVVWRLLGLRRRVPELFAAGTYTPCETAGAEGARLCAFVRERNGEAVLVVVPRLVAPLAERAGGWPLGGSAWGDTAVILPPSFDAARLEDVFTGRPLAIETAGEGDEPRRQAATASVFESFPVAVYARH